MKRLQQARDSFDLAIALEPNSVELLKNCGVALLELKLYEQALDRFKLALALQSHDVEALNNYGKALFHLERYEEALDSFNQILTILPNNTDALNCRGLALLELNRLEQALDSFDRAIALQPNYVEALNNRGTAWLRLNRPELALDNFKRAIIFQPDNDTALKNIDRQQNSYGQDFDSDWYVEQNPDVLNSGLDPYAHYLKYGKQEGRPKGPKGNDKWFGTMLLIDKFPKARQVNGLIAIHLHMYYHDLADDFSLYLENMPFEYDLYVSVASAEGSLICQQAFANLTKVHQLFIEQVPNRGRDIAPMFCTFGTQLKAYDYVAHLHSKKSLYNKGATDDWRRYLCSNLLGSEARIRSIFTSLQEKSFYGIVYPQNYSSLPYQANCWLANKEMGATWCAKLGIKNMPQGYFDFPAGSMFWAKGSALKPLFDAGITLDDFAEESGQTDGTFAHCLERLLVLAALKNGYKPGIIKALDHSSWSAWGFQQFSERPLQIMFDQLSAPKIKLIAFDIFDTLLCRPLLDPEAIKVIVAERMGGDAGQLYLNFRSVAEGQAREVAGKDVGMTEIFSRLALLTGLADKTITQLRSLEEDVEKASLEPRSDAVKLFQQALTTGKPVVLISDMFLPRVVIEECLQSNGIKGWNKLFLSNEVGLRKDTGKLYDFVFAHYGISANEMIIIGDNERSDWQIPCDNGAVGIHILKPLEFARGLPRLRQLIETNERSGDINLELTLGLFLQKNFSAISYPDLDPISFVNPNIFNIGYSIIGPLLVGFSHWLLENARRDGIDRLYFLSREGMLMKLIYELWTEGMDDLPQAEYLVVSRRAVSVSMLKSFEDILSIAKTTYFPNTISNFLHVRYGLQLSSERWTQLTSKVQWSKHNLVEVSNQQIKHLLPLLHELKEEIFAKATSEYGPLKAYLEAKGLEHSGRQAVVDVGFSGSIQDKLNQIVDPPLHGYYMITDIKSKKVSKKHNVIIHGCYLENHQLSDNTPLIYLRSFELEKLLSSSDSQINFYDLDDKNNITAHYRKLSKAEIRTAEIREELQKGAIRYTNDAKKIREHILPSYQPSCEVAMQLYDAFFSKISPMETSLLEDICLDDHYCGRGIVR
jgi:predicted HAD superfamily hydrolase/Tfp pilus assembly protein PilF